MTDYLSEVREVASSHLSTIEADLMVARADLDRARAAVNDAESRVRSLQTLVDLAMPSIPAEEFTGKLTLHDAMAEVLRSAPEHKLRAGEIAAEIQRRRLYQMRDGRAVEPQQIHARVGHYTDLFEKVGTFIKLRG